MLPPTARVVKRDKVLDALGNSRQVQFRSYEIEDEFDGMYSQAYRAGTIIEPPFLPRTLEGWVQTNNTLAICIDAVVTNVHGSGYDIIAKDEADRDGDAHKALEQFFDDCFVGDSFLSLRRLLGQDQEKVGCPYMEVVRNGLDGEIIWLRRLDPKLTRLVRLDEEKFVPKEVIRRGRKIVVDTPRRYRRFVQQIGGLNVRFFKEYGCPLRLNANTGVWLNDGEPALPSDLASEVMYFPDHLDSQTPYGVPKWAPQTPSVIGSRKAEEMNLQFFDRGGLPPAIAIVEGGTMTSESADALRDHLQGGPNNKHSIPVIEAISTGGDMNSPSNVRIKFERFGSERQSDSMFSKYDVECERRIRKAWRLPPMFVGITDAHNFATALVAYSQTEAQVFKPARERFDEMINRSIMRELDPEGRFTFRSRGITLRDMAQQLLALQTAMNSGIMGREQIAEKLSEITGLDIKVDEEDIPTPPGMKVAAPGQGAADVPGGKNPDGTGRDPKVDPNDPNADPSTQDPEKDPQKKPKKKAASDLTPMHPDDLADVAFEYFENGADGPEMLELFKQIRALDESGIAVFKESLSALALGQVFNPSLGIDFADSVVNVFMTMLGKVGEDA